MADDGALLELMDSQEGGEDNEKNLADTGDVAQDEPPHTYVTTTQDGVVQAVDDISGNNANADVDVMGSPDATADEMAMIGTMEMGAF